MEQQQQQKMPSPSQQDAPPIAAEEKEKEKEKEERGDGQVSRFVQVCKTNQEVPSSSAAAEAQVDELCCLSGEKPFFDIVLSKSHVASPYIMILPARAVNNLPSHDAQVVVTHGDRKWDLFYSGSAKRPRFLYTGEWSKFVEDNNLKCGDACIFEVMESSPTTVELKVMFLRNTKCLPSQLQPPGSTAQTGSHGRTVETAIELD